MIEFQQRFEDYGIRNINSRGMKQQRTVCPKCDQRKGGTNTKDLAVNIETGTWFCHSANCGWKGKLDTKHVIKKPVFNPITKVTNPPQNGIYEYFSERRISRAVIDRNKITMAKVYIYGINKYRMAICFNYYVDDDIVNIKYRTRDKHFSQITGGAQILYKLNDIAETTDCIICEGEIDALSFEVAGFPQAVSVPNGAINANAVNVDTKMEYLNYCADYFENKDVIYIATDMDSPGVRLRDELARRLGKSRCYIVNFPEGCKDANETLMKHGIEGLKECIEFAIPYPIEGTHVATDKSLEMQDIYDNGYPNGAMTGWNKFDKFIKFYSGYIGVVSGSPSSGKSNFTDELMIRICIHNDWKFAIFSPENGKMEIHLQRLCEIIIGKPYLPHRYNRMTQNEKDKALAWINDHIYFILPDNESYTIDSILDAAKQLVIRKGIKGLILDPWNALEHSMQGDTETEYTRKMLSRLTYFERNYGLLLLIVAHPTKMRRNSSGRYDICTMYDIAGSANWKNKMEYGFIVHREFSDDYETTKYTDIYIEKVKHIYQGKLGKIRFNYDIQSQRFYEEGEERNTSSFIPTGENYNKVEINKYPLSSHIEDDEPPF